METTIKDSVKKIFSTRKFEDALEATRYLRGDYIGEYGPKSWNALVAYYKKLDIVPEENVAEPENEYPAAIVETEPEEPIPAGMTDEEMDAIADKMAEIEVKEEVVEVNSDVERVEYMLYQNAGDKIDWYGHFINYKGLKVGDEDMMIRMNNLGVGMGRVIATSQMTMYEIAMFHKCYAVIRSSTSSDNRRVMLFKRAFNNLQAAMKDPVFATKTTDKAKSDFVLNYDSDK